MHPPQHCPVACRGLGRSGHFLPGCESQTEPCLLDPVLIRQSSPVPSSQAAASCVGKSQEDGTSRNLGPASGCATNALGKPGQVSPICSMRRLDQTSDPHTRLCSNHGGTQRPTVSGIPTPRASFSICIPRIQQIINLYPTNHQPV